MEWIQTPRGWTAQTKRGEYDGTPTATTASSGDDDEVGTGDYGGDFSKPNLLSAISRSCHSFGCGRKVF